MDDLTRDIVEILAPTRTHKLSGLDISDLPVIRDAVAAAQDIGQRRLLAIYGDHLPACSYRADRDLGYCNCGWYDAFK